MREQGEGYSEREDEAAAAKRALSVYIQAISLFVICRLIKLTRSLLQDLLGLTLLASFL